MTQDLHISIGQSSDAGRKEINQDFFGALTPVQPALGLKGIAVVLADGISSSNVSQIAAQSAVKSFLTDYYSTPDSWSVKTSALRVIRAANSWLYAQTKRSEHAYDMDRGYVCTLSALVLKGRFAHLLHVGDCRIFRQEGGSLELLTTDHRTVITAERSYLARAMGMAHHVDVDYRKLPVARGDVFVLATDGVYEFCPPQDMAAAITGSDTLDTAAKAIVATALARGSTDNLTVQIIRINSLPEGDATDILGDAAPLPAPPLLEAGQVFEGYKVLRQLHANHRSHIYLVQDQETGHRAALKIPSVDLREDPEYRKSLMMEDWIARRLNSAHLLAAAPLLRPRNFCYTLSEYVEGQTLAQWMIDNPRASLETTRDMVEQIAKGLRAIHRKEMLHQDLRPENIMIDTAGTVKIIDFGAVRVEGVHEGQPPQTTVPGTLQYAAPEYFAGEPVSRQSDFFSLAVIACQMLTGKLPYGAKVSRIRSRKEQMRLSYQSTRDMPEWVDRVLKKALHPDPFKRYATLSEFTADLRRPPRGYRPDRHKPLAERDPVRFWQGVSLLLVGVIVALLVLR
jgi:serine/threonine protein phosphatase PrpC/predicted Ser/Thr protein kinase